MGVTTRDIFGDSSGAQPAVPGSYAESPNGYRLPDDTRLGPVHLQVGDLARSLDFYQQVLGMRTVDRHGDVVVLAAPGDDRTLVELHERRGAAVVPRRGALGLYHYAILLPDRASLGRFMQHLADIGVRAGASDHLVSEALYLQDPDNLGIEVYADRPRESWRRVGRQLMMATDPIDAAGLAVAARGEPWTGMPAGTVIGHVHLHVGDIARAAAFYSEALGFDRTAWSYPGALFLGAGGYHHHLGTNTWAGPDAKPATPENARLLEWTIELPTAEQVAEAAASLARAGYTVELARQGDADSVAEDPWGTRVRVRVAP